MNGIAVNATVLGERPSGLGVYTREIVSRLIGQGWLDGSSVWTGDPGSLRKASSAVRVVPWTSDGSGTRVHASRVMWLQHGFRSSVVQERARLVYSTVPEGIVFLPEGVSQVITVHDIIPVRFPALHRRSVWYYRTVVPLLLRSSKAIICNSEHTKKDLLAWSGQRRLAIHVVPEGYDTGTFAAVAEAAEVLPQGVTSPYYLWVGDMRPYKNLERVLEAFASIRTPGLSLIVVGKTDPRYYPHVLEATRRLGLTESVHYIGYVTDRDLACLYRHAVGLVFASLYEGFGLPPLEAMASGCAVIASNTTSLPEVCGEAALYVDPLSVSSIAGRMAEVVASSALREQLRAAGLERARLFSWTKAADQIGEVLESVLATADQT